MRIQDQFIEDLRKGYGDDPWHGPSTFDLMGDLTAVEAARRPISGAHSIWEIVLHMAAWQREVARRLRGAPPELPQEGDWREPADTTDAAWTATKADLAASLDDLTLAIRAFPDDRWPEPVGLQRNQALGTGFTYHAMMSGIVQHNAYHSGQIALLRKWLVGSP